MGDLDKQTKEYIIDYLKDKSMAFVLLIASAVFVALSIIYGRNFLQSFMIFIWAFGATYWTILRKHESLGKLFSHWIGAVIWTIVFLAWATFWIRAIFVTLPAY